MNGLFQTYLIFITVSLTPDIWSSIVPDNDNLNASGLICLKIYWSNYVISYHIFKLHAYINYMFIAKSHETMKNLADFHLVHDVNASFIHIESL